MLPASVTLFRVKPPSLTEKPIALLVSMVVTWVVLSVVSVAPSPTNSAAPLTVIDSTWALLKT